jgi:DNA-binding transcriptional MerR regulator
MNIGHASKASGVSQRMIRHYGKIGLIPAAARRDRFLSRVYAMQLKHVLLRVDANPDNLITDGLLQ